MRSVEVWPEICWESGPLLLAERVRIAVSQEDSSPLRLAVLGKHREREEEEEEGKQTDLLFPAISRTPLFGNSG